MDIGAEVDSKSNLHVPNLPGLPPAQVHLKYRWTNMSTLASQIHQRYLDKILAVLYRDPYTYGIVFINSSFMVCIRGRGGVILDTHGRTAAATEVRNMDGWLDSHKNIVYVGYEKTPVTTRKVLTPRAQIPLNFLTQELLIDNQWHPAPDDVLQLNHSSEDHEQAYRKLVTSGKSHVILTESGHQFF